MVGERELKVTIKAVIGDFVRDMKTAAQEGKNFGDVTDAGLGKAGAAFERTGGAATSFGDVMAGVAKEIVGSMRQMGESITGELDKVGKHTRGVSEMYRGLVDVFVGAEIAKGLVEAARAASEFDDAFAQAASTAKNMGKSLDASQVEAWTKKFALSAEGGGYAIADMATAVQKLASIGATGAQAESLLATTANLAAGAHVDFNTALEMVLHGGEGFERQMKLIGIAVQDAAGNLLPFADVMDNINHKFADAAQLRAESLAGQIGILKNSFAELRNELATALAPAVTVTIGVLRNLVDWFSQLSPKIKDAVAVIVAAGLALVSIGLMSQVTTIALAGLASIFGLLTSPITLVAAAIVGLIALIVEAKTHPAQLHDAFMHALDGIRDAMGHFLEFIRDRFKDLAMIFGGIFLAENGNFGAAKQMISAGVDGMKSAFVSLGHTIGTSITGGVAAGVANAKSLWSRFQDWVKQGVQHVGVPHPSLAGIGNGAAAAAGKSPEDVASNALKNFIDSQKSRVAAARDNVDNAHDGEAAAKAAIAEYESKRPKDKNQWSAADFAGLKDLTGKLASVQGTLAKALADQSRVMTAVAAAIRGYRIDPTLGNADELGRQRSDAERSARHEASALSTSASDARTGRYQSLGQIGEISHEEADDRAARLRSQADVEFAGSKSSDQSRLGDLQQKRDFAAIKKPGDTLGLAELDVQIAEAKMRIAEEAEAHAKLTQAIDAQNGVTSRAATDAEALSNAHELVVTADKDLAKVIAQQHHDAEVAAAKNRTEILSKTAGKLPGASVSATGALSFNPASIFADAIAQSKSFADVMQLVNELMQTFSGVIDAFEPVVDALLKVVAILVNGLISLFNMIIRLVSIFGIQLQQLQYINENFGPASANLITFVHDIPTLNELSSGNIAPLTTDASNNPWSAMLSQMVTNDQHQQTWFQTLITAVGALALIDFLTHGAFLSGLGTWIGSLGSSIGGFFQNLPQNLMGAWNSFQNWLSSTFGPQLAGFVDVAGGVALLDSHAQGIAGWLEKILGVLLIVQGVMQEFNLGSLFGGGSSGGGGGLGNIIGQIFGSSSSGGGSSVTGTPGLFTVGDADGSGGTVSNGLFSAGDADGTGGEVGTTNAIGGANATSGAALSKILGGIGIGTTIGSLLPMLTGGNSTNSTVGGAIGGGLGGALSLFGLAAGPLGSLAGGALGSLIGGLFGPQYNATNNPNMVGDTGNYFQSVANFNGATQQNSSGVSGYFEDSSTQSMTGGQGILKMLSQYISQTGGAGLSSSLVSEFGNDNAGITNLNQGNWTLGSGTVAPWTQVVTDAQNAIQQITDAVNSSLPPTNGGTTSGGLSPADQALIQQLLTGNVPSGGTPMPTQLTTQITVNGDVNGYDDVQQLGQDLAQSQIAALNSRQFVIGQVS